MVCGIVVLCVAYYNIALPHVVLGGIVVYNDVLYCVYVYHYVV